MRSKVIMSTIRQSIKSHFSPTLTMIWLFFLLVPSMKLVQSQESDFWANTNCSITQDRYLPNSPFQQNLEIVLGHLTFAATATNSSFYNSTFGHNKDNTVYGLYLCRGDLTPRKCSSCVGNAIKAVGEDCADRKEVIIWADECMLRYANRNIFSKVEEDPSVNHVISFSFQPPVGAPLPPSIPLDVNRRPFNVSEIVLNLINETAFGDRSVLLATPRFFSTREDNITGGWYVQALYSLAQCTPDINAEECHKCLTKAYDNIACCNGFSVSSTTSRLPSCSFMFDVIKFFHSDKISGPTSLPPLPSPPSSTIRPPENGSNRDNNRGSSYMPIAIAVPSVVATFLLAGFCFLLFKRKTQPPSSSDDIITMESLQFDINTLKDATNNFSTANILEEDCYGVMYKGRLQNDEEIAVKRLSHEIKKEIQDFKNEVLLLSNLQHKNLVKILGYCATEEVKLLVYEFLPNPNLNKILSDAKKQAILGWETRYKIIDGIAKGLLYLHEYSRYKIVHGDLKPSNILLDHDMNPKISNFGLAKLFQDNQDLYTSSKVIGTDVAHEYVRSGEFSVKSDVYSFGVLVLQMVSGKPIRDNNIHMNEAWRLWYAREPLAFVDSNLSGKCSAEEAIRCIHIGLSCIQKSVDKRPTMTYVVSILNSHSNNLPELPSTAYSDSDYNITSTELSQSTNTYSGMQDITTLSAR